MSRRQLDSLAARPLPGRDRREPGNGLAHLGRVAHPGHDSTTEFLLSTYVCHPALANDNLSGVVVLWALGRTLLPAAADAHLPPALEPGHPRAALLARAQPRHARPRAPRARNLVRRRPGPAALQAKPTRRRRRSTARLPIVLADKPESIVTDWEPLGGDERQYCSPGFNLPVGHLHAHPSRPLPRVSLVGRQPRLRHGDALGSAVRCGARDHRRCRDERARTGTLAHTASRNSGGAASTRASPTGRIRRRRFSGCSTSPTAMNDLLAIAERSGLPYRTILAAAGTLEARPLQRLPLTESVGSPREWLRCRPSTSSAPGARGTERGGRHRPGTGTEVTDDCGSTTADRCELSPIRGRL